jgi:hypothetical protein
MRLYRFNNRFLCGGSGLAYERLIRAMKIRTAPSTPSRSVRALHETVDDRVNVVPVTVMGALGAVVGLVEGHARHPAVVHAEGCKKAKEVGVSCFVRVKRGTRCVPWRMLLSAEASFSLRMSAPNLMLSEKNKSYKTISLPALTFILSRYVL